MFVPTFTSLMLEGELLTCLLAQLAQHMWLHFRSLNSKAPAIPRMVACAWGRGFSVTPCLAHDWHITGTRHMYLTKSHGKKYMGAHRESTLGLDLDPPVAGRPRPPPGGIGPKAAS